MNTRHNAIAVAVAALATSLTAGAELRLTPAGEFRARDGRPADTAGKPWHIDAQIAQRVIARIAARADRTVIDYEHQTLHAPENGQPAPAAGWFSRAEWRDGVGLVATDVEWTPRAKAMIEAREYLYFSPVIAYDRRTGEVIDVHLGAITNYAGVDGMGEISALTALAANRFLTKETDMNPILKALLTALGLTESATETEAVSALSALKTKADSVEGLNTQITALKTQTPDPSKYVPVDAMKAVQDQVAALTSAARDRDLNEIVSAALDAGKLLPAQEKWARELGTKDMAALKSYVETAQPIAALGNTQTRGRGPGALPAGGDVVEAAKAEFEGSAALRSEFVDLGTYTAYKKALAEGRVKVLGHQAS